LSDSAPRQPPETFVAHTTELGVLGPRRERSAPLTMLGRYLLEDRIGRGGMGEVFRARDPELDRPVAIKRLMTFSDDEQARLRLSREGQAIAKLSHVNVVQVYDVGRDAATGDMFIAMELVDGVTLRQWLRTGRPWRVVADIFAQAGAGLLAAHREGIVHRDFKPENVLVSADGVAKVADFGLAKPMTEPEPEPEARPEPSRSTRRPPDEGALRRTGGSSRSPFDSDLTPIGARLGTPAYMAPEQASGVTTPRADQFSFAVALFEAFCGYLPFPGEGPGQYAVAVLEGAMLEFPRATAVPKRLQLAIYRALEADPAQRFPTLLPLLAELRRDPTAGRRRALQLGGTLALGGVVTLGVSELARTGDTTSPECDRDAAIVQTVWNDDVRAALEASMASVSASFAADTATRATAALDRTSAAWVDVRRRWCTSSRAEGAPVAVTSAIGACTDRMLSRQRELVASFLDADPEVLTNALDAIERFDRELSRCEDPLFLAQYAAVDDADADRQAALDTLAQARQRLVLGQSAAGLRTLDGLVFRSDPIIALEHDLLRAGLEKLRGNFAQARALLEQGARDGLGADAPLLAAEWNVNYGDLLYAMGDLDGMAAPAERAWMLRRRYLGEEHIDTLVAEGARGHVPYARGDYDAALRLYRAAADRAAASAGETDIDRVLLDEWVAQALGHTGALDEARERTADLVARLEQTRGPLHPRTLELLETQAMIELRAGRNADALAHFEAALARRAPLERGGDPVARAVTLGNIGASYSALERFDEAAAALTEALAASRQAGLGPAHANVIALEGNLAAVHHRRGRLDLALPRFAEATSHMQAAGLDVTSDGLMIRVNYARALDDAGRRDEAITMLRAVVERAEGGSDVVLRGRAAQALAATLDAAGDRIGADAAVTIAARAFADQPADSRWRRAFEDFRRAR
jgi:serine/threonine protein kinase/tetratricopeptide (TPR) repeat protein